MNIMFTIINLIPLNQIVTIQNININLNARKKDPNHTEVGENINKNLNK